MPSNGLLSLQEKIVQILTVFKLGLIPPPPLNLNDWAEKYRYLPPESSSEPGLWRTSRFPYLREIMDELSPQSPTKEVVMMSGTQVGKTEVGLNLIGYTAHYDPCPIMYAERTLEKLQRFNHGRLEPTIAASPELAKLFSEEKSRDKTNTAQMKAFPGGLLYLAGANSATSLRGNPVARIHADEIDNWSIDVNKEGDPVALIVKRAANFPNRKILYTSSPTTEETSRIKRLFDAGDQRYYHVPCPECDHFQIISWAKLVGVDAEDKEVGFNDLMVAVKMKCEACNFLIAESNKTKMLAAGKWVKTYPGREIASFHLPSLYSPLGFYSWLEAAQTFIEVTKPGREADLQVFVNTVWAETWSISGRELDHRIFKKRQEEYRADVPNGAILLTAAFDIQGDRAEGEVIGWGKNQESWGIDYVRFMGDPEGDPLWKQIDDYLLKFWKKENGQYLQIAGAAIDAGFKSRRAIMFCATRKFRRIFPVLGRPGWGKGLVNRPLKPNKDGVWIYQAYVDELKSRIHAQLSISQPGPGFCHFPQKPCYDSNYFKMLAAERLIPKRGGNGWKWDLPKGRRNEALDIRAYNIAILNVISPVFDRIGTQGGTGVARQKRRKIISHGHGSE